LPGAIHHVGPRTLAFARAIEPSISRPAIVGSANRTVTTFWARYPRWVCLPPSLSCSPRTVTPVVERFSVGTPSSASNASSSLLCAPTVARAWSGEASSELTSIAQMPSSGLADATASPRAVTVAPAITAWAGTPARRRKQTDSADASRGSSGGAGQSPSS
jgi:hypothetical protein